MFYQLVGIVNNKQDLLCGFYVMVAMLRWLLC